MISVEKSLFTYLLLFTYFFSAAINPDIPNRPIVTIWVHGTTGTARRIPLDIIKKNLSCPPGFYKAQELSSSYRIRKIAEQLSTLVPDKFPLDHFYVFGWSGYLCFDARHEAAYDLYNKIQELFDIYRKKYKTEPIVQIITHSHGGNVALSLAKIAEKQSAHTFKIDSLILLACPVQSATKKYIHSDLFGKIYSFYSYLDFIQIGDMQGLYKNKRSKHIFSGHIFPSDKKLLQKQAKLFYRPIGHAEYLCMPFITRLPKLLIEMDTQRISE